MGSNPLFPTIEKGNVMKWEYDAIRVTLAEIKRGSYLEVFNVMGNNGWELVSFVYEQYFGSYLAIFKRQIS